MTKLEAKTPSPNIQPFSMSSSVLRDLYYRSKALIFDDLQQHGRWLFRLQLPLAGAVRRSYQWTGSPAPLRMRSSALGQRPRLIGEPSLPSPTDHPAFPWSTHIVNTATAAYQRSDHEALSGWPSVSATTAHRLVWASNI